VIRRHAPRAQDFVNRRYRHRGVVDEVERAKKPHQIEGASQSRASDRHHQADIRLRQAALSRLKKNAHRLIVTCALPILHGAPATIALPAGVAHRTGQPPCGQRNTTPKPALLSHPVTGAEFSMLLSHPLFRHSLDIPGVRGSAPERRPPPAMLLGSRFDHRASRGATSSVAAVAARRVDRLQLLEVELCDGLEFLRQPRAFEAGRQIVEQSRYWSCSSTRVVTAAGQRRGAALDSAPAPAAPGCRNAAEPGVAPGVRLGSPGRAPRRGRASSPPEIVTVILPIGSGTDRGPAWGSDKPGRSASAMASSPSIRSSAATAAIARI
jgi:hypothetical protein